jgi:hypothetical protein
MRIWLVIFAFSALGALAGAQPASPGPTDTPAAAASPASAPAAALPLPSSLVRPAIVTVDEVVKNLRFDRWKKGDIRDEASNDSTSITRDLHHAFPPLIEAADTAPDSTAKLLPAFQNIDAIYDVLLRVFSASRVVGQPDDVGHLQQALTELGDARRALADRMLNQTQTYEKQIVELRTTNATLIAAKNVPPPAPVPCTPPPAVHHKRRTTHTTPEKKPAATTDKKSVPAKPAATKPGTQNPKQ